MPTNAGIEYALANEEYVKAGTPAERLAALKKMISTAPKHKSAEKLNAQLKRRLAELKKDIIKDKKAGKGKSFAIRKEGAATVVFLGTNGSDKTKVFSKLSGIEYKKDNEYRPEMRMIPFEGIWLQGIDLPVIYSGYASSAVAGPVFDMIRTADYIVYVCKANSEIETIQSELRKKEVHFQGKPFAVIGSAENPEQLKKEIWQKLSKIRVYTKTRGIVAGKPVILPKDANVKQMADAVHKDFVRKFRFAKVWGPSARFAGQQVGLEHKLKDRDIVELFID